MCGAEGVVEGYSSDACPAIYKANNFSLIWSVLLLHIIFSTANLEGGGQSSMNLIQPHLEILPLPGIMVIT